MTALAEIVVAVLLVVGGLFGAVGAWGLVRLPDPMTRLHAPTKSATLGVGAVLLASMAAGLLRGTPSWHELLITLFLFLTAPITALYIAKAHLHLTLSRDRLPAPGTGTDTGTDWATFAETETPNPPGRDTGTPRQPE